MKIFLLYGSFLLFSFKTIKAQNANHPTVSNLSVAYKTIAQTTLSINTSSISSNYKVVAQATINLINTQNIKQVYYNIINSSGAIEYHAHYDITAANTIHANDGRKLFTYTNSVVCLSSPQQLIPGQYSFQVFTKDNNGNSSPIYSITQ